MSYFAREVLHEARRRAIHRLAEPLGAGRGEALVLEADRVAVDVPVARVPADVLRLEVLRDVPVRRAQRVLPRDIGRVGDELEGRLVARLGVVDDDVGDLRGRGPAREVVVAVVAGVGAELLVGSRDPLAVETGRAVDGPAVGLLQQAEAGELGLVGADLRGQQRHVLAVDGLARGAGGDHGERVVGEGRSDVLLRGAGRLGHGGIPGPRSGRGPERQPEGALLGGQQGGAAADVGELVRAQRLLVEPGEGGSARQRVGDRCRGGGSRGAEPLGVGGGAEAGVDEVHRAVAARGAVAGVEVPAGLRVGDGLEHRLGHAELGGGRGEGSLAAARVVTDGRDLRLGGGACRQRQAAERRLRPPRARRSSADAPDLAGASSW